MSKPFVLFVVIVITFSFSGCLRTEYNLATQRQETSIYSTQREVALGQSVANQIEKKYEMADNDMQERVFEIGRRIAEISDRQDIIYYFKVIKEETPNALALPGGFIYISDSLVELTDSDDEIAAVLAHEIGHVAARHSVKRMQGSYLYTFLQLLATRARSDDPLLNREIEYAFGSLMIQYSKEDEFEADRLSAKYMKKAGFDPEALLSMLDKIEEVNKKEGPRRFTYFKTHPPVASRKGVVRQAITGQIDFEGWLNRPETIAY